MAVISPVAEKSLPRLPVRLAEADPAAAAVLLDAGIHRDVQVRGQPALGPIVRAAEVHVDRLRRQSRMMPAFKRPSARIVAGRIGRAGGALDVNAVGDVLGHVARGIGPPRPREVLGIVADLDALHWR